MATQSFQLVITNPCSENWDAMSPNSKGRFCDSCQKSVIDFSSQSDEEIKAYIAARPNEQLCGRFYRNQIQRIRIELDPKLLQSPLPFWQKFLVVLMLCFGAELFGCDFVFAQTESDTIPVLTEQVDSLMQNEDTTIKLNPISYVWDSTVQIVIPEYTMGSTISAIYGGLGIEPIIDITNILPSIDITSTQGMVSMKPEKQTIQICAIQRPDRLIFPELDSAYHQFKDSTGIRLGHHGVPPKKEDKRESSLPLIAVLNPENRRKKIR